VLEIAAREGIEANEVLFDAFALTSADEVFICSTLELAVPVIEVAGRKIGTGKPGPITRKFGKLLTETMAREASEWHAARAKQKAVA
jgi:branched-subunit amino acid aminotransferase/4-amino-4-deoxychorismate lyase